MAGIYIHIPFCKQACNYCDFHFSTSLKNKDALLKALKNELVIQKNYLSVNGVGAKIESVYFGGGTPSLLSQQELLAIFDALNKHYTISSDAEITLEANPDDLNVEKLKQLYNTPINRLSIGIQSFYDEDLRFMNRVHDSKMATQSIQLARDVGFSNITIDLIYGVPTLSDAAWLNNLRKVFSLGVAHISCYALTVEPKTALHHLIKTGAINNIDDQHTAQQFELLIAEMTTNNFIQYEISNFCKENFYSKHNSNYWLKENYLGLGPAAHSFNGYSRQWNVRNNNLYIQSLQKGKLNFEQETLSVNQQYNEYILTALRTIWGVDLERIQHFGESYMACFELEIQPYLNSGDVIQKNNLFYLTDKGKLLADKIASDLFVV